MTDTYTGRFALAFIFMTMLIDSIGFGVVIPVLPKLLAALTGDGISGAASWGGWLGSIYALMQFVCAPVIGGLSDRFGRKPILLISLFALGLDYLIMGFAPTIGWLFVGRILSGIAGASYSTANAYIADVSPPEQRAANFGLLGAAFSLGFIIGPALGGVLGDLGARVPFFAAAGLAVANGLFGLIVMRESLAAENRRAFEWKRANPVGALHAMGRFPLILPLCVVVILMRLAHDANPSVFSYYTMLKFGWSSGMVGWGLVAVGALMMIVYTGGIGAAVKRLGEESCVYIGLALAALSYTGYAFATQSWMIFAAMVPFALSVIAGPSLNAIMSRTVGPSEQGELQGALACVGSLTSVAAPTMLTNLFAWFTGPQAPIYFPGIAYLAAALFTLLALALFARIAQAPARSIAHASG